MVRCVDEKPSARFAPPVRMIVQKLLDELDWVTVACFW